MDVLARKTQHPDDLVYEESILRDPHSVKTWMRYVEFKNDSSNHEINSIYERALKELPGSYKLWHNYILKRCEQVRGLNILEPEYEHVNDIFEKSMVFMNKMPRLWIMYLEFLLKQQCLISQTRHTFDRALRSLPITQHYRIWPLYLTFVQKFRIPEMGIRIFRRYLKLFPENAEEYIEYLIEIGKFDSAAVELTKIVNNDLFISIKGKSKYEMWNELCEIISKNPQEIHSLNVDAIIRSGLRRYTDQLGNLWCSLADYYIRSGLFDKARDIYEEAIETVTTVRDFTQVFDAYSQFEEFSLKSKMQQIGQSDSTAENDEIDLEFRLSRFEYLVERRLLLLNSVLLRQNPHNVAEWHKRVSLYEGKPIEIINTYTEAVQTVDPKHAVGKLHTLWIEFAKFYEKNNQIDEARLVFEKAVLVPFVRVDDLATVWCLWCEMEIRNHNFEEALRLMQRATAPPKKKAVNYYDQCESAQNRVHKSLKVWSMYADLEENFGTFKTCKTVYDQILDSRIATPQIVMNYGLFLEENNYFKEAFKAYEKGVSLFKWPNVCDIWSTYLVKYINRYQGTKIEGTRDLFDQCLDSCPEKYAKKFYFLYAKFEEDYGLSKNAMAIYEKAATKVLPEESVEVYDLYIKKAAELFGVHKTREIYERAIETLEDRYAREMCLKFAEMERKLGEIDRARAIYKHCSQLCDPRFTSKFWNAWKEFEVKFGNEDTMHEMIYIKRTITATYNTKVNIMMAQTTNPNVLEDTTNDMSEEVSEKTSDVMRKLEEKAIGFVKSTEVISNQKTHHPEDIDLDIDTDEESGSDHSEN